MQIGPFTIARTKSLPLQPLSGRGGWWSIVREPFMGAWQRNMEVSTDTVLTYSAVFACVTLIASDIAKICLRLVKKDDDGIWTEAESPAFSPVIRKPNRYQTIIEFVEQWMTSKLIHGNTYVLKQRDNRKVVTSLYVLDPTRVTPLVAQDGSVYYELKRDDLSGIPKEAITVPASEIIHDRMVALYHPLMGVSPIYASGAAAVQGLAIQANSNKLFANGSVPGGILTTPKAITQDTAERLKASWDSAFTGDNVGKVAVLSDDLKYEMLSYNAVDMQLIDQLKWTGENVCTAFKVPAYMIGIGQPPPYANIEPLIQQYFSACLQILINKFETCWEEGVEMPDPYGVEFDIDDLLWMDTATRTKAGTDSINGGLLTVNESRRKYAGKARVAGGDTIYLQQQYFALEALAKRDAGDPFAKPEPAPAPSEDTADNAEEDMVAASFSALRLKAIELEEDLYGAHA